MVLGGHRFDGVWPLLRSYHHVCRGAPPDTVMARTSTYLKLCALYPGYTVANISNVAVSSLARYAEHQGLE
jgi:hypothetical protein